MPTTEAQRAANLIGRWWKIIGYDEQQAAAIIDAEFQMFAPIPALDSLSSKPGAVWKRRKARLRQLAFKGCMTCNGRGYIVGVPSSGVRATECACTKGK